MDASEVAFAHGGRAHVIREGKGPPLLFLHSEIGPTQGDDPFIKLLATSHTVVAPHHPGFGLSPRMEELEDVQDLALCYFDLMDALGLEQAVVVGHSLGGMVAAEMASLCPHRMRELVLVAPLGLWPDEHPIPDIFIMTRGELRRSLFRDPDSPPALRTVPERFSSQEEEMAFWENLSSAGRLLWGLPNISQIRRRLRRITLPTMILWGEDDGLVHPTCGELFQQEIEGSRLVRLPGCGHMPHLEEPERFSREVLAFTTQA